MFDRTANLRRCILLAILAGPLGLIAVTFTGGWTPTDPAASRSFQRTVGGLGSGPALDLAGCEGAFDVRLCPTCSNNLGSVPGYSILCPHHGEVPQGGANASITLGQ